MELLYQNATVIKRLKNYFSPYLNILTRPSGSKLFLLLLAMITMQFTTSVSHLYKWFLSDLCGTSLNAYYHLLTYTKIPLDAFFKITVQLSISLITERLTGLPVFLIIDDTLQPKYGTHFECYGKMFDHAQHNGTNYLNGHCFVALAIAVPVEIRGKIHYLSIPVGFRLRRDNESKLAIVSNMVDTAMEILSGNPMVILLCDSWYPKGDVLDTVKKHGNLELIANVRIDTALFDLPPGKTGKKGRPAKKGKKLNMVNDFHYTRAGDYFTATKVVLTNLFENLQVYATITTPDICKHNAYRVFISTVLPETLCQQFDRYEKELATGFPLGEPWLVPLSLYFLRWNIEIIFYEQKTFWSFGLYRLRSRCGIENFVNFSSICYACMKILPHMDANYSILMDESPQSSKYFVGEAIRREIFLWHFVSKTEIAKKYLRIFKELAYFAPISKSKSAA